MFRNIILSTIIVSLFGSSLLAIGEDFSNTSVRFSLEGLHNRENGAFSNDALRPELNDINEFYYNQLLIALKNCPVATDADSVVLTRVIRYLSDAYKFRTVLREGVSFYKTKTPIYPFRSPISHLSRAISELIYFSANGSNPGRVAELNNLVKGKVSEFYSVFKILYTERKVNQHDIPAFTKFIKNLRIIIDSNIFSGANIKISFSGHNSSFPNNNFTNMPQTGLNQTSLSQTSLNQTNVPQQNSPYSNLDQNVNVQNSEIKNDEEKSKSSFLWTMTKILGAVGAGVGLFYLGRWAYNSIKNSAKDKVQTVVNDTISDPNKLALISENLMKAMKKPELRDKVIGLIGDIAKKSNLLPPGVDNIVEIIKDKDKVNGFLKLASKENLDRINKLINSPRELVKDIIIEKIKENKKTQQQIEEENNKIKEKNDNGNIFSPVKSFFTTTVPNAGFNLLEKWIGPVNNQNQVQQVQVQPEQVKHEQVQPSKVQEQNKNENKNDKDVVIKVEHIEQKNNTVDKKDKNEVKVTDNVQQQVDQKQVFQKNQSTGKIGYVWNFLKDGTLNLISKITGTKTVPEDKLKQTIPNDTRNQSIENVNEIKDLKITEIKKDNQVHVNNNKPIENKVNLIEEIKKENSTVSNTVNVVKTGDNKLVPNEQTSNGPWKYVKNVGSFLTNTIGNIKGYFKPSNEVKNKPVMIIEEPKNTQHSISTNPVVKDVVDPVLKIENINQAPLNNKVNPIETNDLHQESIVKQVPVVKEPLVKTDIKVKSIDNQLVMEKKNEGLFSFIKERLKYAKNYFTDKKEVNNNPKIEITNNNAEQKNVLKDTLIQPVNNSPVIQDIKKKTDLFTDPVVKVEHIDQDPVVKEVNSVEQNDLTQIPFTEVPVQQESVQDSKITVTRVPLVETEIKPIETQFVVEKKPVGFVDFIKGRLNKASKLVKEGASTVKNYFTGRKVVNNQPKIEVKNNKIEQINVLKNSFDEIKEISKQKKINVTKSEVNNNGELIPFVQESTNSVDVILPKNRSKNLNYLVCNVPLKQVQKFENYVMKKGCTVIEEDKNEDKKDSNGLKKIVICMPKKEQAIDCPKIVVNNQAKKVNKVFKNEKGDTVIEFGNAPKIQKTSLQTSLPENSDTIININDMPEYKDQVKKDQPGKIRRGFNYFKSFFSVGKKQNLVSKNDPINKV